MCGDRNSAWAEQGIGCGGMTACQEHAAVRHFTLSAGARHCAKPRAAPLAKFNTDIGKGKTHWDR